MRGGIRAGIVFGAVCAVCAIVFTPRAGGAPGLSDVGTEAWWYRAMGVADAHRISTGTGVLVALIDGPVDPDVPELQGQNLVAVRNFCGGPLTDTGENAGHATSAAVKIIGNGRGTGPGGVGVAGIAPDAVVRSYVASESAARGPDCRSDDQELSAIAKAIDAAVADHVRIISTSLGLVGGNDELRASVRRALDAGVVVVAATGDNRVPSVVYPAAVKGTVAVAAVDDNYLPWSGNVAGDRDAFVISAPGYRVPTGYFVSGTWSSLQMGTGTSEATPLVAGGLALVAARYPNATGNQLIQDLIHNPDGQRGFGVDPAYGYGVISVPKMLAADPRGWPDVNPLTASPAPAAPDVMARPQAIAQGKPAHSDGPDGSDRLLELAGVTAILASVAFLFAAGRGAQLHSRRRTGGR